MVILSLWATEVMEFELGVQIPRDPNCHRSRHVVLLRSPNDMGCRDVLYAQVCLISIMVTAVVGEPFKVRGF